MKAVQSFDLTIASLDALQRVPLRPSPTAWATDHHLYALIQELWKVERRLRDLALSEHPSIQRYEKEVYQQTKKLGLALQRGGEAKENIKRNPICLETFEHVAIQELMALLVTLKECVKERAIYDSLVTADKQENIQEGSENAPVTIIEEGEFKNSGEVQEQTMEELSSRWLELKEELHNRTRQRDMKIKVLVEEKQKLEQRKTSVTNNCRIKVQEMNQRITLMRDATEREIGETMRLKDHFDLIDRNEEIQCNEMALLCRVAELEREGEALLNKGATQLQKLCRGAKERTAFAKLRKKKKRK
jgi:hypothetical protein